MEESDFDSMDRDHLDRMFDLVECPICKGRVSQLELDTYGGLCEVCKFDTEVD